MRLTDIHVHSHTNKAAELPDDAHNGLFYTASYNHHSNLFNNNENCKVMASVTERESTKVV
jgi:hypothetical protein